ncbi:MAG: lamin tail domain-containing protein, partial [Pseudomonadota bacterium]
MTKIQICFLFTAFVAPVVFSCSASGTATGDVINSLQDIGVQDATNPIKKDARLVTGPDKGTYDLGFDASMTDTAYKDANVSTPDHSIKKDIGPKADTGLPPKIGIMITEIMANPDAVSDLKGEWFELYNAGKATVNLHGWLVKDTGGSSSFLISAPGGQLNVAPGQYLVLGRNQDPAENGGVAVDFAYGSWSLSNSSDQIGLFDKNMVLDDEIKYDSNWNMPEGA